MLTHSAGTINVELLTAAGTVQADATAIPRRSSPGFVVVLNADDAVGIRLPTATKGKIFHVKNTGTGGFSGILNVYPAVGDNINALSANAPLLMATLTAATFIAKDSTTWYTIPLLPS